ncbi:MAG TPA: hypothetical protein DCY59_06480 [Micrococcaceae bacterium]|nr:hypothetical protein [Micrococcaceae bacterium]
MDYSYACATEQGLKYHMRRNEPCKICKDWWTKVQAGQAQIPEPVVSKARVAQCGTPSGAKKHRRLKEPRCEPCRLAENAKALESKRRLAAKKEAAK